MKKWLHLVAALVVSLPLSLCVACDNLEGMLGGIMSTLEPTSDMTTASTSESDLEVEGDFSADSGEASASDNEEITPSDKEENTPNGSDENLPEEGDAETGDKENTNEGAEGSGSTEEGELVSTAAQLTALVEKINRNEIANDITIRLGANIDMTGVAYTPIYEFRGVLDGKGYKISNLQLPLDGATISLTDGNWVGYTVTAIGLIGSAYDADVRNLTLENVTANFDTNKEIFIGAIVGYTEGVEILDCTVSSVMDVTVTHESVEARNISGVAGVIGYSLDAYMNNVDVTCEIDYKANSYEAFVGAVLGVGNVRIHGCEITLDISFIGDMYGHTGSVIGMERTPEDITLASMYDSIVKGKLYIKNDRGYDWGEVGQGYFYDPETREILDVESCNEINVQKTKE